MRILQSWVLRFVDVIFSLRRLRNWPVPVRHGLHELHGVRRWDLQQRNGEDHGVHRQVRHWEVRLDRGVCVHIMLIGALPGFDRPVLVHGVRFGQVQFGNGADHGLHRRVRSRKILSSGC